ncbi:N-6 DNA methylase [Streptomyces sp. L500]
MTQLDFFADLNAAAPEPAPIPATFAKPTAPTTAAPPAAPRMQALVRSLRPRLPANPHERALSIGEAVARTWHTQHGGTAIEVPIGIVAALALMHPKDPKGPNAPHQILAQDDVQLIQMYREIWARHWMRRPDLIDRARILHDWLNDSDHDKHRLDVTRAVTRTALTSGLLDLTGHEDPFFRTAADVLSPTMTALRSSGAQQGLGEYHTPPSVAECMAEMMLQEFTVTMFEDQLHKLQPGQHIHDPACGSGGMLRAAAQSLRQRGKEPASFRWSGVDIDQIAAACTAVNAIIWDLGPHVTVACADILTTPNAVEEAAAEAQAVIEHRNRLVAQAHMLAGIRKVETLLNQVVPAA